MIYIERLNLYFVLNKVAYVLQTTGSAESPQFRIDGKTKDYYKMKLINDSVSQSRSPDNLKNGSSLAIVFFI